ncbi:hypothetical protein B5S29_g1194 [[Candida] boidinii]|nr:hypothetical protein B5S29_g1194 [[Candida] boidinii]
MQYKLTSIVFLGLFSQALGAYMPSEPWSTLTPSATLEGGATSWSSTFGIAIEPLPTTYGSLAKRDVAATQIGDGQIQATTATETTEAPVTQIGDGQIQATTATEAPVTQIGDGQIQATTATEATVAPVTQIGDGQIQATTATVAPVTQIGDGQIQATTATVAPVTQIGDGQIQATTATVAPVTQIGDGQIQATTASGASQIEDGQVQATTASGASQVSDGQVQATSSAESSYDVAVACKADGALAMTLEDGILKDSKGRIGSIVANRQFQFDGPPPQAGAIYAAGWGITDDGYLSIGDDSIFWQCLSGTFYNLYDQSIGGQCSPVHLKIVDLVEC